MRKVADILAEARGPLVSFEIIPPKRGGSLADVLRVVDDLRPFDPAFIDVTSHAATESLVDRGDGTVTRRVRRRRPGTLGLCAAIQARVGVPAVPHLLCHGFTREETEDALIEMQYLGLTNLMALRGDDHGAARPLPPDRSRNDTAADLVAQIADLNRGRYLDDLDEGAPTDFCVAVAGYPEKHIASANRARDLAELKRKVDAGADYVVTQMFFDNRHYLRFVDECRAAGIDVPIVPGLKILTSAAHLTTLPKTFFLDMPDELVGEVTEAPEHAREIGVRWAIRQSEELLAAGVPYLHYYILQSTAAVREVLAAVRARA